jgi:hypothetical protein
VTARSVKPSSIIACLLIIAALLQIPLTASSPIAAAADGKFAVDCPFTHRSHDDPIVYPGQPGAAHMHDFFGNRSTDADSTYRSMRNGRTSCRLRADAAGYWIPTLIYEGVEVEPSKFLAYYRTFQERPRTVVPFPKGLKVVAGDAHATKAQSLDVVYWDCEDGGSDDSRARPSDCGNGYVSASVIFPECWDGRRLDSRDHGSHLRYPIDPDDDDRDSCPKSHPVPLPRMNFSIEWPVHDGTKVTIGSGSPITLHGDFFNTWRQRALRRLTVRCLVRGRDCGVVSSPDRVLAQAPLRRRP